ncbi:membrane cofactor protein isoform X4 [Arvicanthis niloticus]|uniref:membrane cofactor protein isoform X4 n=1 Tax=Arvicanthis niloticus TaxID=61156 RepID=UPI00402B4351
MELKGAPKLYYAVGERIEYKCKKGYLYLFPYLMIATCEPNNTWVPISDDGCIKVQCNMLQDPSFGKVHYIDGRFSWGARARFTCMEGYYLVGMSVLHCVLKDDDTAHWNGHPPNCEKIYCLPPPKIKNGTHTFTNISVFKYHEAVIYSCDHNPGPDKFSLVGSSMLFCTGHNTWSNNPPECKVVKCPFPVLQNGRQIPRARKTFSYQATVMFECLEGFYMEGSSMAVCSASNSWEPSIPKCLKGYPSPREGIFGQELDAWINALIVITSIAGVAVICLIMLRYLEHRKKASSTSGSRTSTQNQIYGI